MRLRTALVLALLASCAGAPPAGPPLTPAPVLPKIEAIAPAPLLPPSPADLTRADELRAAGDLDGATSAYLEAVREHRDPLAYAALGDMALRRGDAAGARRFFDEAIHLGGGARVVTYDPGQTQGPMLWGSMRPDPPAAGVVLQRALSSGGGVPSVVVGPRITWGPDTHLSYGPGWPLTVVSRDGRRTRRLALNDVYEAAFAPADGSILAVTRDAVHRVDPLSGAVVARHAVVGGLTRLLSPSRVAVGTQVFRVDDLALLYEMPHGAEISARIVAHAGRRGRRALVVVRRSEDGGVVFEHELEEGGEVPITGVHPSGRFAAWVEQKRGRSEARITVLDLDTGKLRHLPVVIRPGQWFHRLRLTADGKAACFHETGGWRAAPVVAGVENHCWVHEDEAKVLRLPPMPGFKPAKLAPGSISPNGRLAAFCEIGGAKPPFRYVLRVVDVATQKDVGRFALGTTPNDNEDAWLVTDDVVETLDSRHHDARTGAPVPPPPGAHLPHDGMFSLPVPYEPEKTTLQRAHLLDLHAGGGDLELDPLGARRCWKADLRPAPDTPCRNTAPNDLEIKRGLLVRRGGPAPARLSIEIPGYPGFVARVGGAEVLVFPAPPQVRYFSMTGALAGTVASLGGDRLIGFLPDGSAELFGSGDEGRGFLMCLAGDVVLPWEACADELLPPGSFVRRVGGGP